MTISAFEAFACPLDGSALQLKGRSWQCEAGHSFDIARQGYVHLLPVQNKRSKDPGDNKEMVAARQRFLNAGFYQPIADALSSAVFHKNDHKTRLTCLDAGCGEGYTCTIWPKRRPAPQSYLLWGWIFPSGPCWQPPSNTKAPHGLWEAMQTCLYFRKHWTACCAYSAFPCIRNLPGCYVQVERLFWWRQGRTTLKSCVKSFIRN